MHNLKLLRIHSSLSCFENSCKISSTLLDNKVFIADSKHLFKYDMSCKCNDESLAEVASWEQFEITASAILSCDIVDTNVCVTTAEGDVIVYNTYSNEVEVAGSVDGGIAAASWSPDQEILVVVTPHGLVILLNLEFIPIHEFHLDQSDFGESKFMNVGWGKKETQFHGSEGKQAARSGAGQPLPAGLAEHDDTVPRISWRGDAQFFAVSYVESETKSRKFKVVDRAGVVQYTSEIVPKLEQVLAWKPSGSVIASSQRLPNKYNIIFFEKNGLRHGEFNLQGNSSYNVKELLWNADSSVLLVWLESPSSDAKKAHCIQLWTVNNYKWYLKYETFLHDVLCVCWDASTALTLYLITSKKCITYAFVSCVYKSHGLSDDDLAVVAVIHFNKLMITPFKRCKIPPPMAACEIVFKDAIQSVCFPSFVDSKFSNCEAADVTAAVNCSNAICVVYGQKLSILSPSANLENLDGFDCSVDFRLGRSSHFKVTYPVYKPICQFDLGMFSKGVLCNVTWVKQFVFAIYFDILNDEVFLVRIDITSEPVKIEKHLLNTGPVLNLCGYKNSLIIQTISGVMYQMNIDNLDIRPAIDENSQPIVLGSQCLDVKCATVSEHLTIFGLSLRNRLYCNNMEILGNCTSFNIHSEFLVVTTTDHKLLTVPFRKLVFDALVRGDLSFVGERNVERGSRIITAVSGDCELVLQMPRGNIETIYPRHLLVHILKRLLDEGDYSRSVELMRKHRVDMNLIYDHNPMQFVSRAEQFVRSVKNASWIDLFIAGLKNEDTTKSMYALNYFRSDRTTELPGDGLSKVDKTCLVIRKAMISIDEIGYLLPILTSYVKMDHTQMDEALKLVKNLKDSEKCNSTVTAEEGLRHLLYIADASVLCDVALGTYDFDLVMMVFEKSQKDPKEFLPFLNNLRKMEENYMKYRINVYLKRYRKAIACIRETGIDHLDECLTLVKKEKLFSVALEELSPGSPLYCAVAEAYADYNLSKGYYHEAALLYERADKLHNALEAYKQQANWKRAIIIAYRLQISKPDLLELYDDLVTVLKEKKMFHDAAALYLDYLSNEEEAIACLSLAHAWDDAVRVANRFLRLDLIETNILPELLNQGRCVSESIANLMDTFRERCQRLEVVREHLLQQKKDLMEGVVDTDADLICDTSTVAGATTSKTASCASGRTYRSFKNRRKLERKKYSTKEGNSFEDLGIVSELHALVTQADRLADPVGTLVSALFSFQKDDLAYELQNGLHRLLRLIETKHKVIWPSENPEDCSESSIETRAYMSTAELLNVHNGDCVGSASLVLQRLKLLETSLRYYPKPTRPADWALGFLYRNDNL